MIDVLSTVQGFVATLKDSYGFIESEEHDCELFFPFRSAVSLFPRPSGTRRRPGTYMYCNESQCTPYSQIADLYMSIVPSSVHLLAAYYENPTYVYMYVCMYLDIVFSSPPSVPAISSVILVSWRSWMRLSIASSARATD